MAGRDDDGDSDALAATAKPALDATVPSDSLALAPTIPPASADSPGETIGRYRVTGTLGRGGMGIVYAAYDPDLDRPVAIKVLRAELRHARARLLREGQAIARLTHPNVVAVYDVGALGDDLFIAMELVSGGTLSRWFQAATRSWQEVLDRMIAAGRGLAAAHAVGLIHRDFKPDNVLIGNDGRVVVTDFGLAQLDADGAGDRGPSTNALELTRTGALLGTPAYMAPEQLLGQPTDARSDQFSFCVSLWEGLAGSRPFAPNTRSFDDLVGAVTGGRREPFPKHVHVPGWLLAALRRGLATRPADRFASMDALLAALTPRRSRIWIGATLAGVAIAGALGVAALRSPSVAPLDCESSATAADEIWNAGARLAHRQRFATQPWVDEEAGWFTEFASRWNAASRRTCEQGETSRTRECLTRALERFRLATTRVGSSWPALDPLEECEGSPMRLAELPRSVTISGQGLAILDPTGRRVAISSLAGEPQLVAIDDKVASARSVDKARAVLGWLADDTLLVEIADGSLELRSGSSAKRVAGPPERKPELAAVGRVAAISSDGRWLARASLAGVEVLRVDGGERVEKIDRLAKQMAWEPGRERLALVGNGGLTLFDATRRTTHVIPMRLHSDNTGGFGVAWIGPGRLAISGGVEYETESVWTVRVDEMSRLVGYPEQRARPDPHSALVVSDGGPGRTLLTRYATLARMFRRTAGRTIGLPSTTNGLHLVAADPDAGLVLGVPRVVGAFPADVARVFSFEGRAVASHPMAVGSFVFLRGRDVFALVPTTAGYDVVEMRADGSRPVQRTLAARGKWPSVRCAGEHCVIVEHDGRRGIHLRALFGSFHREIPSAIAQVDVTRDGHVLVPRREGTVTRIELASGKEVDSAVLDPSCVPTLARRDPDGTGLRAALVCPDRFEVGHVMAGRYRMEISGNGYVSGLEVVGPEDLLYSSSETDVQLMVAELP